MYFKVNTSYKQIAGEDLCGSLIFLALWDSFIFHILPSCEKPIKNIFNVGRLVTLYLNHTSSSAAHLWAVRMLHSPLPNHRLLRWLWGGWLGCSAPSCTGGKRSCLFFSRFIGAIWRRKNTMQWSSEVNKFRFLFLKHGQPISKACTHARTTRTHTQGPIWM